MSTSETITESDAAARAARIAPLLESSAEAGERQGSLPTEVVEALHETGLFGIWAPRALGGEELAPVPSLGVISQLAQADASAGWVQMNASLGVGTLGAYLGDAAVDEMFGGERFPVAAGQATRPGTATTQEDGAYSLNGSWNFGSGISHANWVISAALVQESQEPRIFVVPREQVRVTENWDVLGLRATGSHDYAIANVPVPPEFSHPAFIASSARGGGLYRLGTIGIALIAHTAWAIGVGRRVLDELLILVDEKAGRPGAIGENPGFHSGLAEAEAKYRAARAFAYEVWGEVEATILQDRPPSVRQQTLTRLALNHVTWTSQEVAQFAYATAGTSALRTGRLQRVFRDAHAGTQHVTSSMPVLQACGRELTGLHEKGEWKMVAFETTDP